MTQDPGRRPAGVPRPNGSTAPEAGKAAGPQSTRTSAIKASAIKASAIKKSALTGRWPFIVAGIAVLALLVTIGTVGFLSLRTDSTAPTAGPAPQGAPQLPQELGDLIRDPSDDATTAPTPDEIGRLVSTGRYLRDGRLAYIVTAVRPAGDPRQVLEGIETTAIREMDSGFCGREPTRGLDTCAAGRRSTVVVVIGMRDQVPADVFSVARDFASALG